MHAEAFRFVCRAANLIPPPATVLEIGSRNVNGSARSAFTPDVRWHGIDKTEGADVDAVCDFLDIEIIDADRVDLVVCCEMLEHEYDTATVVSKMRDCLNPGGHLLITTATTGRAEHSAIDGGALKGDEHYRNIEAHELLRYDLIPVLLETHLDRGDLYALMRRS